MSKKNSKPKFLTPGVTPTTRSGRVQNAYRNVYVFQTLYSCKIPVYGQNVYSFFRNVYSHKNVYSQKKYIRSCIQENVYSFFRNVYSFKNVYRKRKTYTFLYTAKTYTVFPKTHTVTRTYTGRKNVYVFPKNIYSPVYRKTHTFFSKLYTVFKPIYRYKNVYRQEIMYKFLYAGKIIQFIKNHTYSYIQENIKPYMIRFLQKLCREKQAPRDNKCR